MIGYGSKTPLIYTRTTGWTDARESHPDLMMSDLTIEGLNDRNEFIMRRGLGSPPDSRFNRIENFYLKKSGKLFSFGAEGPLLLTVSSPHAGQIVGNMVDPEEPLQAFAWTPGRGLVPISIPGAIETIADWAPLRGVVAGQARFKKRRVNFDALYVYSLSTGTPDFVVREGKFRRLAQKRGFEKFKGISATQFNKRIEFIGEIHVGRRQMLPFLYRRGSGLFSIQALVDAAGVDYEVRSVNDLNRRGQMLIHGTTSDGRGASAILTPVG